ncbi:MAG TPA: hypothetical protein VKB83_02265 [Nitrosopumilaceae archaeon]|nr:hypothetical protein [Nitrosopumilaceae archaeon]
MHTRMQYSALVACALLIIPAAAFADNSSTRDSMQQSYLNAMLARATCQANAETGYIGAAISDISNINQTAISADSGKITADLQTLTTDVNNKDQFKVDLKSFRTDSLTGTLDMHSAIKDAKPTSDQKTKLKSDFSSMRSTYQSCMFGAIQQFANVKLQVYGNTIQKVQNRTNVMASKGMDTTKLNLLISQAQTNLGNLAASVSSATNSSELKTALKSYCQYNGCKSGVNFHFAAQTALSAEQSVLDSIKSNPNSGQYRSKIDQAQTDLTNAQNILITVGTSKYQGTQQTDVWNDLHDSSGIIKQLWGELNGHKKSSSTSNSTT